MHSVLDERVMAVELISRSRQPYYDLDALYFLVPCAQSISMLMNDFSPGPQSSSDRPLYAHAHLFFTGALPTPLFRQLSASRIARYIRTISELYIEFNPIESRAFLTTPSAMPFYTMYSPHATTLLTEDLDAAAERLLSVIVSLKAKPYIRYYRPGLRRDISAVDISHVSPGMCTAGMPRIAEAMANRLQLKLDSYNSYKHRKRPQTTTDDDTAESDAGMNHPATVIILDRSIDMFSPFLHELTYQAMVHDLLELQDGDKYTFEVELTSGEAKKVEAVLSETEDPLWAELRHMDIMSVTDALSNRFSQLAKENAGISALQQRNRPLTLQEMRKVIANLPDFKKLHASCIATQLTEGGTPASREYIEQQLITLLDNKNIRPSDRIRLLFVYLVYRNGGYAPDRRRLQEVLQCMTMDDKRSVVNLNKLGIPTTRDQEPLEQDAAQGTIILYVAGGMTYSEMRTAYEVAEETERNIFIGSTHIITPLGFLEDLKTLHHRMLVE
ncbi:syntaxin binding protein 1 [Linderina pennispora]|nr:syntaxin binding protein 1 [Linderina pennispora]